MLPDPYNPIVEGHIWKTGFYHIFQIGVVQCQSALINALVERWRPETHTFHLPVCECVVTLEDVALILGLSTNGLPITRPSLSSFEAMEAECLDQFSVVPMKSECQGSFIKLTWFQGLKDRLVLADDIHIQRALCRTSCVDCKEVDGPLTLWLTWAWIRLSFLAPIPGNPRLFPIR
ncbi:protein MAIN-LIKE 1-like isoform X2 [Arachis stenosperma]|uniref:protein MAIN-LIKE 1-like isoform X2 n=1 Tax=Arachis stenosperma TaxID=217475 RepID=UPI0025AC36F0|nr:protein MAIN-LIKE 1-like isoform X2 [Arachis stenosperma]